MPNFLAENKMIKQAVRKIICNIATTHYILRKGTTTDKAWKDQTRKHKDGKMGK